MLSAIPIANGTTCATRSSICDADLQELSSASRGGSSVAWMALANARTVTITPSWGASSSSSNTREVVVAVA